MKPHAPVIAIVFIIFSTVLFSVQSVAAKSISAMKYTSVADSDSDTTTFTPEIHPSQLEYWPLLYGRFNVQAFLERINSPLKDVTFTTGEGGQISFASELDRIGSYYHIHPRILLTFIEVNNGWVLNHSIDSTSTKWENLDRPNSKIDTDQQTIEQIDRIALVLRANLTHLSEQAWLAHNPTVSKSATAVIIDTAVEVTDNVHLPNADARFVAAFRAQFETWFGPLYLTAPGLEQDWGSVESFLPYITGSYTGAPHGTNNPNNLPGLDFGSSSNNGEILSIADGWFVEKGRRGNGIGNYVKIQIENTEYAIEYWHLGQFSTELESLDEGQSFVPHGFPLGKQGGTTNVFCNDSGKFGQNVCKPSDSDEAKLAICKTDKNFGWAYKSVNANNECLYSAHIHLQLVPSKSPNQPSTSATWDTRKLDDWIFFVDTTTENREKARSYGGTAVLSGTKTKTVLKGQDKTKLDIYSVVGDPETSDNTKYATTTLSSNNIKNDCTTTICQPLPPPIIEIPTAKAILQAGPHSTPAKNIGPIRILVDKQFTTLPKNSFEVLIGGKTATIQGEVTPGGVYNTYELIINPPTQPADGLYDLEVKVKGVSATSPQSVQYGAIHSAAYTVLLDTSRSMNCSLTENPNNGCDIPVPNAKIYVARTTSENFIQLLQSQESIGFVRFRASGGVDDSEGQPQLATPERREYLSSILRDIIGDGGTPLYDAIKAAVNKLSSNSSPTKVVVVLSDGADSGSSGGSQSTIDSAIQAAQQAGVQVCTIRLGEAAILDVLNRISKETGCVAAQSALNPDELEKVLTTIRTSVSGLQTVNTASAVLQPGETQEYTFNIDQLAEATFQLVWQNLVLPADAKLVLQLIAPNGTQYTPDQLNGAEYISGIALSAFRINQPLSGSWRLIVSTAPGMSVQAAQVATTGVPIEVSVAGNSDLKLRTYADGLVEAGNLLELGANIANPEPITGATVLVSIERPSGSKVLLPLLDDGAHGDGFANDGYYSAAFYDTFQPGTYHLEYSVEGTLPTNAPFQRFGRRTVEVEGNAGLGIGTFALDEGLNLIGLNGLAPTARTPKSALLSISDAYTGVLSYNYQDGGLGYFEDLPDEINTLKEIDPFQGYWIRTTKPVTLQVSGPSLLQDHYIPVHPGWNLVPYLTAASTPITEALSSIEGSYLAVRGYKNGAMSFWPQLPSNMNTLQTLEPGLGYWILISDTHTILQYPAYFGGPPSIDEITTAAYEMSSAQGSVATTNHPQAAKDVTPTEQWMDLYSFAVQINGQPAPSGTMVSVYDPRGRKIGGAIVQTPGWVGVLSAYGKSSFTDEIDGALPGDVLTIRINGEPVTATDPTGNPVRWLADGALQQIVITAFGDRFNLDNTLYLPLINQ
ncbi:MAG: VWA domain-containing protein [Caldilineaceae bacterium]